MSRTQMLDEVLTDLAAEGDQLDHVVALVTEEQWSTPTPAVGWDVATQIAHLAWTDEVAVTAATDKDAWDAAVLEAMADPEHFVDRQATSGAQMPPAELLERWRAARAHLHEVLRELPAATKIPWYGPPMSATSMATARLMETWAHSLDVHEALGVTPQPSDRIRHIAHLAVRTRNFAFSVHDLAPPADEFRIDLVAPSGDTWSWGPEDATQTVTGPAYDLCLLATQRVHRDDTMLVATGSEADHWLDIAQCFAGPAGEGRDSVGGRG